MADLQIGRVGLASASGGDGLELKCTGWSQSGDEARVSGVIRGQSSLAAVKALRDQLNGYGPQNTDEPVVPVTWAQDSSVDGFYEVAGVDVSPEVTSRLGSPSEAGGNLAYTFEADLRRVPGWQAPIFEILSSGAVRTNGHGATGDPWVGFPLTTSASYWIASTTGAVTGSATTAAGTVVIFGQTSGDSLYGGSLYYYATAADFYKASCKIEWTPDSGTTWYTLTGCQLPNYPVGWRIGNHLVRATCDATGILTIAYYDGSSWESTNFIVYASAMAGNGLLADSPRVVSALRNSPEAASIRLTTDNNPYSTVDLSVRRGGTLIEGRVDYTPSTDNLGIYRTASENGTSITGGIEATAADANGNKYVMLSPDAITKDVAGTSGIYTTASASTFSFGVGPSNSDLAGGITVIEEYFAANNIRQRIVAR